MKKQEDSSTERQHGTNENVEQRSDVELLSAIKRAMATERAKLSDEEIDKQWQAFEAAHYKPNSNENARGKGWRWTKIAAMFVGVVMIAGVAFATIQMVVGRQQSASPTEKALTDNENSSVASSNMAVAPDSLTTAATDFANIVEFDDVELHSILTAMADYYKLKLKYENEQSKHIRMFFKWNKQSDIASIVELLNSYDRISIALEGNTLTVK